MITLLLSHLQKMVIFSFFYLISLVPYCWVVTAEVAGAPSLGPTVSLTGCTTAWESFPVKEYTSRVTYSSLEIIIV